MPEVEGAGQPQRYCPSCGAEAGPGNAFCVSCGERLSAEGATCPIVRHSGSRHRNPLNQGDTKIALCAAGALMLLIVAYLLLSYSVPLGFLLIGLSALTALVVRKTRGTQTRLERRAFERAGQYRESARKAYEDGKHREFAQNVHRQSKRAYEEANTRYRYWSESRAAERAHNEVLRAVERNREARRQRFQRYDNFFEKAQYGSRYFLDWWQAYQDEKSGNGQPLTSNLLRSALERAEAGLTRMREMESTFLNLLQREEFEKADLLLDGTKSGQEDFEGEESVFPPLVAVHGRVKGLDGWTGYRGELEALVRDLEDLLGSPAIKTPTANRVRFPKPDQKRVPDPRVARFPDTTSTTGFHRGSPGAAGSPPQISLASGSSPREYVDEAIAYMVEKGFSVDNRSDSSVTFVRSGEELDGASCGLIVILSLAGLIPGILYAIYLTTRRMRTTLVVLPEGDRIRPVISGNDEGGRSILEDWLGVAKCS